MQAREEAERVSVLSRKEVESYEAALKGAQQIYEETDECTLFLKSPKSPLCLVCVCTAENCSGRRHEGRFYVPGPRSDLYPTYLRVEGITHEEACCLAANKRAREVEEEAAAFAEDVVAEMMVVVDAAVEADRIEKRKAILAGVSAK